MLILLLTYLISVNNSREAQSIKSMRTKSWLQIEICFALKLHIVPFSLKNIWKNIKVKMSSLRENHYYHFGILHSIFPVHICEHI